MKYVSLLLLLILIHSPACADDEANKKDARQLQGCWRLESLEVNGQPVDIGENKPRWFFRNDGQIHYAGELLADGKIDAATSPKSIDLVWANPKRTFEAIYLLDGDTLKICVNKETEGVKERPSEFTTENKANTRLLTFQREKTDNPDPLLGVSGFVGVMIKMEENQKEVSIAGTLEGSPAQKAGLKKDDVLLAINEEVATDLQTVVSHIRKQKPGQDLIIKFKRDGKDQKLTFKVGKIPFLYLD